MHDLVLFPLLLPTRRPVVLASTRLPINAEGARVRSLSALGCYQIQTVGFLLPLCFLLLLLSASELGSDSGSDGFWKEEHTALTPRHRA